MKNVTRVFCLFIAVFAISVLHAQPGCPAVNVTNGDSVSIPCSTCTTLRASAFSAAKTTSYTVSQIPYTPFSYTAGTPIFVNQDDIWSAAIPLPFTFCFFNQSYNQVVVGANSILTFNAALAGTGCDWDLTTSGTVPTTNVYGNTIMGPYQDIDPSLGGTAKYQIFGTAPCRIFVISYYQIPMYDSDNFLSTCSGLDATSQIAFYETTNAIEIYIAHKSSCPDAGIFPPGWNDGLAIEGIQNATQTVAYTVPGRNNTVWNADNDAWRFTPSGANNYTISWLQGTTQIGLGDSIQVCPTGPTTYTANATYVNCNGATVTVADDVYVGITGVSFNIDSVRNVTCHGANNGYAHVTLDTAGVTAYGWTPGGAGQTTISNLAPGQYVFSVTSGACGTLRDTITITEPPTLTVSVPDSNLFACGSGVGGLTAHVSGGTPNYNYNWSVAAANDSVLTGQAAGAYSVTVTDAHNCTASATGNIVPAGSSQLALAAPTITNVRCNGGNTGAITANATGGAGTITYTWNTTANTATITGLTAGTYAVTATDGAGCSVSATYIVTQPAALIIDSAHVNDYTCLQSGSITLFVSGGAGGTTYTWSGGLTPGNPQNTVNPGTYAVTVADVNGCSVTQNYTVNAIGNVVILNAPVITNVSCSGNGADGAITANATGGTGTLLYVWSTNDSTQTITGLTGGNYIVTVSDQSGCRATATYTVNTPTPLGVSLTFSDRICFGTNTGAATANVTGGTSPFTYVWSEPGGNGNTIGSLAAGFIGVTVTDANGCSGTASAILQQTAQIVYTSILNLHLCSGNPNGDLSIQPTGGIAPLVFSIPGVGNDTASLAGADTTGEFTNIAPGTYTFSITDSLGCTVGGNFVIPQGAANDQITVSTDSTSCFGTRFNDGSITLTPASNQNAPYTYSINGTDFQPDSIFANVAAGAYQVTVKNSYGCVTTVSANVGQPEQLTVSVNPDTIVTAPNIANQITVTVNHYNNPVYDWTPTSGLSCVDCANPNASTDSNTTYVVKVSEATNSDCYATGSVVVIVTGGIVMPNAFTPNGDSKNDFFGPVKSPLSTVTAFRVYNRWGVTVHNSIDPWDGKYNGQAQGAGTYVYYIAIETPDPDNPSTTKTINQQGSVVLLR